jgi:amino acid permease
MWRNPFGTFCERGQRLFDPRWGLAFCLLLLYQWLLTSAEEIMAYILMLSQLSQVSSAEGQMMRDHFAGLEVDILITFLKMVRSFSENDQR